MKLRLFLLLSCVYLGVASREPPWGDAHVVYETTQRLVDHGRLDVDLPGPPQFFAHRLGRKYGVFPLGNVIAMAPSYLAYKALAAIPHAPSDLLFRLTSHITGSLLIAGTCVLFMIMARRQGASERAALWLALGLGLTTILVIYARSPFSEALQTLAFTWTLERGLRLGERLDGRGAFWGGVAAGILINTKLIYVLVVPVMAGYVIIRHWRTPAQLVRALAIAAAPLALLVAGAMAHNHLKTGDWLDSGYRIPVAIFSGDMYAALDGFFLSTGKSIFLYSPLLVLGFAGWTTMYRRARGPALLVLAMVAVVVLANARFRHWHADYCWGPRLLVPLTPAMLLPAAPWLEGALGRGRERLRALLLGALVGAGLWVQFLGASFYWDHYIRIAIAVKDQTGAGGWYQEDLHHCHFIPQFSPLVGHSWMLRHLIARDKDPTGDAPWRRVIPGAKVKIPNEWGAVRPDWWGLEAKTPGQIVLVGGILAVLVGGIAWSGVGLRRRLARA